jgi:hypothetical protein
VICPNGQPNAYIWKCKFLEENVLSGVRAAQSKVFCVVFCGVRAAQSKVFCVVFCGVRAAQSKVFCVVFCGVRAAQSKVFCVVFCRSLLSLLPVFFWPLFFFLFLLLMGLLFVIEKYTMVWPLIWVNVLPLIYTETLVFWLFVLDEDYSWNPSCILN